MPHNIEKINVTKSGSTNILNTALFKRGNTVDNVESISITNNDYLTDTATDSEKENNLSEIAEIYSGIKPSHGTFYGYCGDLTSSQLIAKGIGTDKARCNHGKDLAKFLADNKPFNENYDIDSYFNRYMYHAAINGIDNEEKIKLFDNLIKDNKGTVENLVISFNKGGSFQDSSGHVVLISKIENGNVYLIDDISAWSNLKPTCYTIDEFKDTYLKDGNQVSYMVHIIKTN